MDDLKVHLVNNTSVGYQFNYRLHYFGKEGFELQNQSFPFQDFYLHDVPFENLNDNPAFEFDFTLLTPDKQKEEHYESSLKIKAKQVFAKIEEIRKKGEATFSFKLFDNYPDKKIVESSDISHLSAKGYKIYEASKARSHLQPSRQEVDLHIEKLSDN